MAPNGRLTLFEHYDIFVCPISESMPECLALQQKYASLFHIKKCSTQYVAHFIWVTDSLKIGEYATICSTLYVLPSSATNLGRCARSSFHFQQLIVAKQLKILQWDQLHPKISYFFFLYWFFQIFNFIESILN